MRRRVPAVLLTSLAVLVGCGGGDDATPAVAGGSSVSTSAPTPAPDKGQAVNEVTARSAFEALVAAGLPAKLSVEYNEETDENKLLGRPGQYTSKLAFTDERVSADEATGGKGDVSYGGGIEVFANEEDAKARYEYVSGITKKVALFAEYSWQIGRVFLRISHVLTPSQAEGYKTALEKAIR